MSHHDGHKIEYWETAIKVYPVHEMPEDGQVLIDFAKQGVRNTTEGLLFCDTCKQQVTGRDIAVARWWTPV